MARHCNYWWVTRPKRKLNSIPEILSVFASVTLEHQWNGGRALHIQFEDGLEDAGLKRKGSRRDGSGSGGRTYAAWLRSLGLIVTEETTGRVFLTLAGEAIANGKPPVKILKKQVLEYQFPSSFSLSVGVDGRFKLKPFRFLLRLLMDSRIGFLSEDEVGKIVITEAETDKDFEKIVSRILQYRAEGDKCLPDDFFSKYLGEYPNLCNPYGKVKDIANTLFNWLEYTQLTARDEGKILVPEEKREEVQKILDAPSALVQHPEDEEKFQRRYGLDPWHRKDTRNLLETKTVSSRAIDTQKIKTAFIQEASKHPVGSIFPELVDKIAESTGTGRKFCEDVLEKSYPHGMIGGFLANYYEMAFKGTEEATDFEVATTDIFREVFHYNATHLGQTGSLSAPDVLLISDSDGYQAVLDNKAYSKYSITGDHHNRMVNNYLKKIASYSDCTYPIGFFAYIAGGFISTFDKQVKREADESGVHGSGITVGNFIKMVERAAEHPYSHGHLRNIFSLDRQVRIGDIISKASVHQMPQSNIGMVAETPGKYE